MCKFFILSSLMTISILVQGQTKNLPSFDAISTSGNVQVELIKSSVTKAEYTILKGNEEDLQIEVKGKELTVKIKSSLSGLWNRSNTKARVKVYYQTLTDIDCSAGSSISSDTEIASTNLDIEASSGANCQLIINTSDLEVNTSSGASVSINGTAKTVTYDASSGARIDASRLEALNADADVSSGGSISLYASKKLVAEASSGGSIKYRGNPESTNIDSGMSGSIKSF